MVFLLHSLLKKLLKMYTQSQTRKKERISDISRCFKVGCVRGLFFFEISSGARHLVDTALLGGSQDNCTAIVIPLGAWGKYKSPAKKVRHLFIGSSGRY